MGRKCKVLSILTIILLAAICLRFFDICIIKGTEYKEAAGRQRVAGIRLEAQRGDIYDRNMVPFTNRKGNMISYTMPNSSIYNIFTTTRYDSDSLAKFVTGYIKGNNEGETGVEGLFNTHLESSKEREIVLVRDARFRPINGFGYTITESGEEPYNVKLTLDYKIQKICEGVFEKNELTGAFVCQDISNGDILAIGSFPDYEHGHIADYLDSSAGELTNRATSSYSLGSVFKTVVTACAIENGFDLDYSYYCTGSIDVTGQEFKCHVYNKGGHGILSLKNAVAGSCNTYFIDLGLELGMEKLVETASLFGFGEKTGLSEQGLYETRGNLPDLNGIINDRAVANISIGQGEILVTPLQVTNAMTVIANGGVLLKPNIVDSIVDSKGRTVIQIKSESASRIIKESTARQLQELMEEVSLSGTAHDGLSAFGYSGEGIFGKTGSAETGRFIEGKQIVHSWFSAFTDKYTLTIFLENGVTLEQSSVKIFAEIMSEIEKL